MYKLSRKTRFIPENQRREGGVSRESGHVKSAKRNYDSSIWRNAIEFH